MDIRFFLRKGNKEENALGYFDYGQINILQQGSLNLSLDPASASLTPRVQLKWINMILLPKWGQI